MHALLVRKYEYWKTNICIVMMSHLAGSDFPRAAQRNSSNLAQSHLGETKSGGICCTSEHAPSLNDGRRRPRMQQAAASAHAADRSGRVAAKIRRRVNNENKRATEAADRRPTVATGAPPPKERQIHNMTAALSPPLSKLGKLLHGASMPSACPCSQTLFFFLHS